MPEAPPTTITTPTRQPNNQARLLLRHPNFVALLTGLTLAFLGYWLHSGTTRLGRSLVQASYNTSLSLALPFSPTIDDSPVVLVYLDLESYLAEKQNPAQPWDRALHAQLLHRLARAQARAVVFDILFTDPGPNPQADRELAEAVRTHGNVVLGAESSRFSRLTQNAEGVLGSSLSLPIPPLLEAAASWGLVYSSIDEDFVVRRHFPGFANASQPSLSWAALRLLNRTVPNESQFLQSPPWLRYYGPPLTLPHVSYTDALQPAGCPDSFFHNRIVFVGARPMVGGFLERKDEQRSPLAGWTDAELFHPGVEIHAIQMLNLLRNDWLTRWSPSRELIALALVGFLTPLILFRLRPLPGSLLTASLVGIAFTGAIFSVARLGQWYPWLLFTAVQLPLAFLTAILRHSLTWYRERRRFLANQRQAERTIRQQAALLDKAHDAILLTNLTGELTYANPGACSLYAAPLDELRAANFSRHNLSASPETLRTAHDTVLHRGEWSGELHQRSRKGDPLVVQSSWTLIRDEHGQPQSILMINTDITEKKEIEAQLHRTQRMQTIGSLAGGMAHDLNNALAPVLMGVQLLRRRSLDDDARRMLEVMEANTQRGADLVRQVLLFARGRLAQSERLHPDLLLREVERLLRETLPPSINLHTLIPDDLWPVLGQPTQIHQSLLNLCVNARDAMPHGGSLTLAADNVTLDADEAACIPNARPGSFVMLLVADSGTGIPPDIQNRVFEPFFTTKPHGQGTGLGLSVVASIIKNHNGFLRLESSPSTGTSIEIYLPHATTEIATPTPANAAPPPRGHGELILVVDDELSIREMLAAALNEQGYQALTAASGIDALPLARHHANSLKLMILDHLMPLQNGSELLPLIRSHCPGLPAVLASGEINPHWPPNPQHDPSVAVLPKPFPLDDLFRTINQLLRP